MARVLVPLAAGCEELEAVTIIDLLRRADIEVVVAGLNDGPVVASRGIVLMPDTTLDEVANQTFDMVVLPGGLPGADHLNTDPRIQNIVQRMAHANQFVGAICAAPKVLASAGVLKHKTATAYPGVLNSETCKDTKITQGAVEVDGNIVTSRSPGTAMDFALTLIACLKGATKRQEVETGLQR